MSCKRRKVVEERMVQVDRNHYVKCKTCKIFRVHPHYSLCQHCQEPICDKCVYYVFDWECKKCMLRMVNDEIKRIEENRPYYNYQAITQLPHLPKDLWLLILEYDTAMYHYSINMPYSYSKKTT